MSELAGASDRDPQKKALTDLISRFTADRDRMITAVQDCETRLEDLVTRLRGHDALPAAAAGAVPAAELENVRAAMRELTDEMEALRSRDSNAAATTASAPWRPSPRRRERGSPSFARSFRACTPTSNGPRRSSARPPRRSAPPSPGSRGR